MRNWSQQRCDIQQKCDESATATNDSTVSKVQCPLPAGAQQIQSEIYAGFHVCAIATLWINVSWRCTVLQLLAQGQGDSDEHMRNCV